MEIVCLRAFANILKVVDEVAAAFGLVNEIVLPLEADHAHLPKFHSDRDINYIRISGVIERWSNLITGTHPHLTAQLGSILRIPGIRDSTEGRALRKSEDGIAPDTKLPPLYHLAPSQSDPTLLSGGNGNETTAASSSRDDGDVIGPNTILPPLPGPRQFSGEEDSISTTESKDKGASSSGNPNETNSNLTLHPPPRLRLFQTDKDREISLEAKFKAPLIGSSGSGTREGDTNRNTVLPHLKLTGSSKSPVDVEHTQSVQSPINGQFGQFMSEPEEYRSSLPKVGGNGISSILPPFPSSNPSLPSVPPSKAGKAIANGLQTASSAAVAASAWDPPAVAATVGAGVAGAALLVQGIGAMTARETLGVSREALLTSRRAAIASGNSASIAKAALELNREVFEWNKAKGLNVGVGKKKTPGGGGGEPSSYGGAGTLDGSTFPSLEEFSREFHGTPGFQDSSEDEEGGDEWNSVVRPPTYSTLEETKQKGKGKEVMRDTYIESGVTPGSYATMDQSSKMTDSLLVMTAQPVRGYSVVRKPVPVASTSSQAGAHGQIKPPVAKRTLFSYGFTIKEPSSQSPISRTSDVSMAQNLSSEPPPTTKASPNVEPSPADSRDTTTEDICENISISTDSRDDRVREEAELENVSDEEETEDVSDPISKIYEAEGSLEKVTSSRVELHTTEAPDPDTEVFVAPRFDPALITDRELIVGNGDDVIEDADSVFFRDEAESNEENVEQEFELQMPNGQIQKEDAEFLVSHSSGEGSTREEPRLETFSDRYMDEHTERKSSIASDLGNGQREADVMDFTRKNIPDEASGLAQLASQNRGSETDATREETRYEKVDSDPSNSQIRENELDECHKLRIPNPPMVNGTKAETQQVTVSGIALPRDADVESSEMDDIAVTEPQIADSGDGDGINKQPTFTPSELQMERLEKEEMTHSVDVEATNLTAGTAEISSIIVRNGNSIEESDSGLVNGVRETQKQVLPTLEQHSHDIVEPVTATCERRELC